MERSCNELSHFLKIVFLIRLAEVLQLMLHFVDQAIIVIVLCLEVIEELFLHMSFVLSQSQVLFLVCRPSLLCLL